MSESDSVGRWSVTGREVRVTRTRGPCDERFRTGVAGHWGTHGGKGLEHLHTGLARTAGSYRGDMDTAAEIFLLLTNDEGGSASWGTQTGWALSAATIADLLIEERVVLDEQKDPRVRVVDATPTGRAVLDKVLAGVVE